ncbi:MAG: hypothetical protein U1A27_01900 [Phycisphaerae bacterium]
MDNSILAAIISGVCGIIVALIGLFGKPSEATLRQLAEAGRSTAGSLTTSRLITVVAGLTIVVGASAFGYGKFQEVYKVTPPIGSIIAWHKNLDRMPRLPEGWVECNGGNVNYPGSPLNGDPIPDLNHDAYAGGDLQGGGSGRFLRGGTTSGVLQDSTLIDHEMSQGFLAYGGTPPKQAP